MAASPARFPDVARPHHRQVAALARSLAIADRRPLGHQLAPPLPGRGDSKAGNAAATFSARSGRAAELGVGRASQGKVGGAPEGNA
jgi:hypothetical protein